MVDGILASCYGSYDHDLAHLAMTPMRMFPGIFNWTFNEDNRTPLFIATAEHLGRWLMPYGMVHELKV